MAYQPGVYRTSGGDEQVIASSGRLYVEAGTLQLSTAATLTLAGQTVTTTGNIAGTSGIFTAGVTLSSTLSAVHVTLTSGIGCTTGNFSGGVTLSSTLTVQGATAAFSGGVNISSGLTVQAGYIWAQSGYREFVETATSSWSAITRYGDSRIKSTDATPHVYSLPAPISGQHKYIVCFDCSGGTTSAAIVTSSGASAGVNGANTSILFTTGATVRQYVHLLGVNTTAWEVVAQSTDVSLSTT